MEVQLILATKKSKLINIHINKFRGLQNVDIDFGERITLICGKNGTAKSTILGIIAQVFSFSTDYTTNPVVRNGLNQYKTLLGKNYTSVFSEHFRFSEEFDLPGSMDVELSVYDGLEKKLKDNLSLKIYDSADRSKSRPVLRGNNDRNITLPVIYLSVNRLTPIVLRRYNAAENSYISDNINLALMLSNRILLQENNKITSTSGDLESLATHDENYDYQSISVGEDNVGQIVKAMLSFKKLKEEFENYSGGILLIDEADAGLFPAAQVEFFKELRKFSKDYNVQVIMTSHSPTLIQEVFEQKDTRNYKTIYLTNTYGPVEVMNDFSWSDIEADINVRTKQVIAGLNLPLINVYFEDNECREFFKALIRKRKLTKVIKLSHTSLGGEQLLTLKKEKIPEFSSKSIIVLDSDKEIPSEYNNFINLPGRLPPDQLIFETLYNLPNDEEYWKNPSKFTKSVFQKIKNNVINDKIKSLFSSSDTIDLGSIVKEFRESNLNQHGLVRETFKNFYRDSEIQMVIKGSIKHNPFTIWKNDNEDESEEFERNLIEKLRLVYIKGYKVPKSLVDEYFS